MKSNGEITNTVSVKTGSPQGSLLGSLIFLLFKYYPFADDCPRPLIIHGRDAIEPGMEMDVMHMAMLW